MAARYYTVDASAGVVEQFRRLLESTRADGRGPLAARAARYIWDELGHDPGRFGESRDRLDTLDLTLRIAFAGRWTVLFGVHEAGRRVFVRGFRLSR